MDTELQTPEDDLNNFIQDYSLYMKVDIHSKKIEVENAVDEMLTRLDEFCGILDLAKNDASLNTYQHIEEILVKNQEMEGIYKRIDAIEIFINMVKEQFDDIEKKVNIAEQELVSSGKLMKVFSSLYRGSSKQQKDKAISDFTPPEIFSCEELFNSN